MFVTLVLFFSIEKKHDRLVVKLCSPETRETPGLNQSALEHRSILKFLASKIQWGHVAAGMEAVRVLQAFQKTALKK